MVQSEMPYYGVSHFSPYIALAPLTSYISNALTLAMQGSMSVAAAAQQITTQVNATIKRNRALLG